MSDTRREIERYNAGERTNHWLVAICFVLAALSGLALFHPALVWLANLFGGGTWTRILHPYIGLAMALAFAFLAARFAASMTMEERDWDWLRHADDVVNKREERVPAVGRFNGGQKLVFFVMLLSLIGLFLSGLAMWRAYFAAYFPVGFVRFAADVHAICAVVLICTIIVHIYAGIWVKGSIHAMTSGTVTPGWAWKHHRAWFRDVTRQKP